MSSLPLITKIAREVRIVSPTSCEICGELVPLVEGEETLGQLLYDVYYLARGLGFLKRRELSRRIKTVHQLEHPTFSRLLRDANIGRGWVYPGWRIVSREGPDSWRVTDGDVELLAGVDEISSVGDIRAGAKVALHFPKHFPYRSPGYYLAVADDGEPRRDTPKVRVYVNVDAADAPTLLRGLTGFLCGASLRAVVKTLNDPGSFGRPDALVIYCERDQFDKERIALKSVLSKSSSRFSATVPGFTRPWLRGVGVAENPPESGIVAVSFGEHRTHLIAMGLLRGDVTQSPLSRIKSALTEAGLDPAALHLNPGSREFLPG